MTDAARADAPGLDQLRFRLNFFKLNVRDIEGAATFYRDAFGMEERNRIDMAALTEVMLAMPGEQFTLVLLQYKDGRALELGDGYGPVGFLTRDAAGAVARVLAHGGSLVRDVAELPGMRYAFVADPEGHQIELMQFVRPPSAGA